MGEDERPELAPEEAAGGTLFDAMGEDSYVALKRRDDRSKQWVYHGRLSPSEANEEFIAATYGGGEYLAVEKVRRGDSGKYVFARQRTIKIAGAYKGVPLDRPIPDTPAGKGPETVGRDATGAVKMDDLMMSQFVQMMQMNNAVMKSVIETARPAGAPVDWGAILGIVVPSLTTLMTAMMSGQASKRDPVEIAAELMDKLKANAAPVNPLKDRLEEMKLLREVGEAFGGGGGEPESIPGLLGRYAPDIIQALQGAKATDQGAARAALTSGAPAKERPTILDVVASYLPRLTAAAASGRDPGMYAQVVVDQVPAPFRASLRALVVTPGVVDTLIQRHPPIAEHRDWLVALVDGVKGELGVGPRVDPAVGLPDAPTGPTTEPRV